MDQLIGSTTGVIAAFVHAALREKEAWREQALIIGAFVFLAGGVIAVLGAIRLRTSGDGVDRKRRSPSRSKLETAE